VVESDSQRIVIDPGVALGYMRAGRLPHPIQVEAGAQVRQAIIDHLNTATDVVFSHYHGDHMPLVDANPFQLSLDMVSERLRSVRLWIKELGGETPHIAKRQQYLFEAVGQEVTPCSGESHGRMTFSELMPHGLPGSHTGTVMMTRIEEGNEVFVHASDIQLLDDTPVSQILDWNPSILLVSGPPLYRGLSSDDVAKAAERVRLLAGKIDLCIIDHHLLRCEAGIQWLDGFKRETWGKVVCAADFMRQPRRFLEAERLRLYQQFPVQPGWHERYAKKFVEDPVTDAARRPVDLTGSSQRGR
jgi:hypothetical protein